MMNENKTLEYYNKNADNFAKTTIDVNFYETQKHFQELLPEHGYILDFGCGSGRDTKYFFGTGLLCRCHRRLRGNVSYRKQLHRNTSQKAAI